ncbi:uncharacterized protein LOC127628799 [Xyrauchen texanus]|uniref:uncharacterized protein LOC127628799 n=1 Tax=Xyrauchen texanus TaxID=154827 RepID=UPI0022421C65|nr:uncharacterized protein LOC127628799 [Xyrauchen texanus]
MYKSMLDDYIRCENQLKTDTGELNKKLEASKETERCLRDMYASIVDDYIRRESQYKKDIEKLQKKLKHFMAKEKHQEQKPGEAEDGDTHHITQVETDFTRKETDINQVEKDLARRETDLERREKELKPREREMAKTVRVDSKHEIKIRMECPFSREYKSVRKGKIKSSEEDKDDSRLSGTASVCSKDFDIPNMSESEHGPFDTLWMI